MICEMDNAGGHIIQKALLTIISEV